MALVFCIASLGDTVMSSWDVSSVIGFRLTIDEVIVMGSSGGGVSIW